MTPCRWPSPPRSPGRPLPVLFGDEEGRGIFQKTHGPNAIRHSVGADVPALRVHRHRAPRQYSRHHRPREPGAPNDPAIVHRHRWSRGKVGGLPLVRRSRWCRACGGSDWRHTNRIRGSCRPIRCLSRRSATWSGKKIDAEFPADLGCHLVLDNASTDKTPPVKRWLTTRPASSCTHRTLVPRTDQQKNRAAVLGTSVRQLNKDIPGLDRHVERQPTPLRLVKTADQTLASIGNYCIRINDSGHS